MSCQQELIVPAYFYPTTWDVTTNLWKTLEQCRIDTNVNMITIMNPNSGPEATVNSDYLDEITIAKSTGMKIIAYVATSYGTRNVADIKSDIDKYYSQYGSNLIDGIFFDEAPSAIDQYSVMKSVVDYAHSKSVTSIVVLNPGTETDVSYIDLADINCIFEDSYSSYLNWTPPSYVSSYSPSKFCHIIHSVSNSNNMLTILTLSQTNNAGYVYITNDIMPNPYDTLPSYLTSESTKINDCNLSPTSSPTNKITFSKPTINPSTSTRPTNIPSFKPTKSAKPTFTPSTKRTQKPTPIKSSKPTRIPTFKKT
eukprot:gene4327-6128_t